MRWSGAQQSPQQVPSTLSSKGVGQEYSPHSILEQDGVSAVLPKLSSVRNSMPRRTSSVDSGSWCMRRAVAAATSARQRNAAFIAAGWVSAKGGQRVKAE